MAEMTAEEKKMNADKDEWKAISARHERMKSDRSNFESNWQECFKYIVPRKAEVNTKLTPGDHRGDELFDSTAIMANSLLAGALHSMLTNQTTEFFDLVMVGPDAGLNDDAQVKSYLQECTRRMHQAMNNSNFQTEVHELYIDLGAIGTASMFVGEHPTEIVHFAARTIKEMYAMENNLGLVDIIHREFEWTPRQICQEFGEKSLPPDILKKYKEGDQTLICVVHVVEPYADSGDTDVPYKAKIFAYRSRYFVKESGAKLEDKGFREMPFVMPRWTKTSGETYGRGPGMDMLPDIKMVNEMMRTTLEGAQLTVRPPIGVPDDGVVGRVRMTPGGLTVIRQGAEIKPIMTGARVDFGYQAVEDVRKRVRAGFFVDKIQLNDGPQKTATEVNQIVQESLRYMGPILGRQHFEFLRPLVVRVFGIMNRAGKLPPVPDKIRGKQWDVRYSSLIARAQQMSEIENFTRAIAAAAPIVNAIPSTLDNIDGDKAFRYVMDRYGVPQFCLSTDQKIKQVRDARAKAQQQAAQDAREQHQADIVSKVGPTALQSAQTQRGQSTA